MATHGSWRFLQVSHTASSASQQPVEGSRPCVIALVVLAQLQVGGQYIWHVAIWAELVGRLIDNLVVVLCLQLVVWQNTFTNSPKCCKLRNSACADCLEY